MRGEMPRRMVGGLVALVAGVVLAIATVLTPSAQGVGTHEQLRLPQCTWVVMMDLPCPTCGMTTSFAHAANGSFLRSFLTQPVGFVLAMVTAMALLLGCYVAITGSPVASRLGGYWTARVGWAVAVFFVAAWIYKILSYREII